MTTGLANTAAANTAAADPGANTAHRPTLRSGCSIVGTDGKQIGYLRDVIRRNDAHGPIWFLVDTGILRADRYAPVRGAEITRDGRVVVPFDKQWLRESPKASGDHILDERLEAELIDHYGSRNV